MSDWYDKLNYTQRVGRIKLQELKLIKIEEEKEKTQEQKQKQEER